MLFNESKDAEESKFKVWLISHDESWRSADNDDSVEYQFLKAKYVADAIGNDYLQWNPNTPVLISAQTGSGKNTFIERVLIPQVEQNNKKILIISNRVALSLQTKRNIVEKLGLTIYNDEWLKDTSEFKYVHIVTYHKFMAEKNNLKPEDYLYVVLDEVHFFMTDAIFNYKTDIMLNAIVKDFKNCIRVYMTATPEEIAQRLVDREKKNYPYLNDRFQFNIYDIERDYSYVNPRYFSSHKEIVDEVKLDDTDAKWLIFVTSKEKGKELQKELFEAKVDAVYFDSDAKNNKETVYLYNQILKDEKFPSKVLVSTSVLDNGINFNDDKLKNIVIFAYDRTAFLQMLGRKRLTNKGETVNLYLQNKTSEMINGKKYILYEKKKALNLFNSNYNDFLETYYNSGINNFEIVQGLFYFHKGKCWYNSLGNEKIKRDLRFLSNLIQRIKGDSEADPKIEPDAEADIKEQLSWLGLLETFDEKKWLSYSGKQESIKRFNEFLKKSFEKSFRGEEQTQFATTFKTLYREAYDKHPGERSNIESYGMTIINNILRKLNFSYVLVSKQDNKKTVWYFKKNE